MATAITCSNQSNFKLAYSTFGRSRVAALSHRPFFCQSIGVLRWNPHSLCYFFNAVTLPLANSFKKMAWSIIRSSVDSSDFNYSSNGTNRTTRLIREFQAFQSKLNQRLMEVRKGLPMKLFFFLVGFYCATAFATVIGQTGDWDILSAALAVVVVEGIGALMYTSSIPLLGKIRSLITMFNYWKAGLSLGLFLDSFKY